MTDMEQQWLSETSPEDFFFSTFPEQSCVLRRHNRITGALASLKFGSYMNNSNRWVPREDVVWLGMITSDRPGDGGRLLKRILELAVGQSCLMVGEPTPLKPKNWPASRPWFSEPNVLVEWYRRHGFAFRIERRRTLMCYPGSRIDSIWRGDTLACLGGDEFGLIVAGVGSAGIAVAATDRLRRAVGRFYTL
jgi:hypothetical protein